jgi:hypothetical protein
MEKRAKYELAFYAVLVLAIFITLDINYRQVASFVIHGDEYTRKLINVCAVSISVLIAFRIKHILKNKK